MDQGREPALRAQTENPASPAAQAGACPEVDLDRLVWDLEYREAMRPLLGRQR